MHYNYIKSYIANGKIAPAFIYDYIKPNDKRILVVLGVPLDISPSIWDNFAIENNLGFNYTRQHKGLDGVTRVYDVELWIKTNRPEPCKSQNQSPKESAASVHYDNLKSYIVDGRVAPSLVDDYIKPVGRFVVKSVPIDVSTTMWTAFALANGLDAQFIKHPPTLSGKVAGYDVELWPKK